MLCRYLRRRRLRFALYICLPQVALLSFIVFCLNLVSHSEHAPLQPVATTPFNLSRSKLWSLETPASRFPDPYFAREVKFPTVCNTPLENHVLLVVPSKSVNYESRIAIRDTWFNLNNYNNLKFNYSIVFVIGLPNNGYKIEYLQVENELWQDILVTNLSEDYRDLTIHLLLAYNWIKSACPSIQYIYKIDDDTYVHLKYTEKYVKRLEFLRSTSDVTTTTIFGGTCYQTQRVIRNASKVSVESKWIVPQQVYRGESYPPYCNGPIYFFSASLLHNITRECPQHCVKPAHHNQTNDQNSSQLDPSASQQEACFWQFEDVFFGSCFYFMNPRPFIQIQRPRMFLMQNFKTVRSLKATYFAALHPVKKYPTILHVFCKYMDCSSEKRREVSDIIAANTRKLAFKSLERTNSSAERM